MSKLPPISFISDHLKAEGESPKLPDISPISDECREAFEQFHADQFGWELTRPEHYQDRMVSQRWKVWQAAWNRTPPSISHSGWQDIEMDKAVRDIADKMARRDRATYPNATTMPSSLHYEQKAREIVALMLPYLRTPASDSPVMEALGRPEMVEVAVEAMGKVDSDDVGSALPDEEYEPYAKAVIAAIKKQVEGV